MMGARAQAGSGPLPGEHSSPAHCQNLSVALGKLAGSQTAGTRKDRPSGAVVWGHARRIRLTGAAAPDRRYSALEPHKLALAEPAAAPEALAKNLGRPDA